MKTVYAYNPFTGEFLGETSAERSPLDIDEVWLLPAHSTELKPPETIERQAVVFRDGGWTVTPDWRAVKLWSIDTAQPVVASLGDTPDSLRATSLPPCEFPAWNGKGWIVNSTAQAAAQAEKINAQLKQRLAEAYVARRPLEDAESIGIATGDELERLTAWKRYCVMLSRVPQQPGFPSKIAWPALPDA
ncbi:tail fiber assembly protein [Chromobacterium violaceum]|uniref:tail fiber assembly protein n=1 Tax=Chromobacterium violaceum TaxID=536 RepID=UPI00068A3B16|nr:tail fiber assembly protein [Chromobacterium violaceum]